MKKPAPKGTGGKRRPGELKQYWSLSSLGIEIGVSFGIGAVIGYYLDRTFGTEPWLIVLFSLFGVVAGFRNIVRLARKDWSGGTEGVEKSSSGDESE